MGLSRSLVENIVVGVSSGFDRKLELQGVGYRAQVQGQTLKLALGFSHDIDFPVPEGIKVECPSQTEIVISGTDKQKVGQVASEIAPIVRRSLIKAKACAMKVNTSSAKKARRSRDWSWVRNFRQMSAANCVFAASLKSGERTPRLSVYRSSKHIYAQLSTIRRRTLAAASTKDKDYSGEKGGNVEAAGLVGKQIAERAIKAGVENVIFDRGGYIYHGRVKALAEAAREAGLKF